MKHWIAAVGLLALLLGGCKQAGDDRADTAAPPTVTSNQPAQAGQPGAPPVGGTMKSSGPAPKDQPKVLGE